MYIEMKSTLWFSLELSIDILYGSQLVYVLICSRYKPFTLYHYNLATTTIKKK